VLGVGIASLAVGMLAATGAWVPFCGVVWTVPFATIGVLLGGLGIILALTSGTPGRRPKPLLPIAGAALSAAAILACVLVTRAATQRAARIREERLQQQQAEVQRMQREAEQARREAATRPVMPATPIRPPEPGLVRGRLSMRQYNGLSAGATTYSQAVALFGAEGVATEGGEGGAPGAGPAEGGKLSIYTWNDRFGGVVTCTFRDDKLASKSQRGLR
jgi:hypothetical protein